MRLEIAPGVFGAGVARVEQIGNATLYLADCREVLAQLPPVDLMLTDPPYGVRLANHDRGGKTRSDRDWSIANDDSQELGTWALEWAAERNLPTFAFASPMKPWPGKWRQHLVWEKGEHVGGGGDPALCWKANWELLQVARNDALTGRRDGSVLRFQAQMADYKLHPTPKPVDLLTYILTKATRPHQLVLDPFMGSGSTGVACTKIGRRFIGCEIDPEFFDAACKRIDAAARQSDLFAAA